MPCLRARFTGRSAGVFKGEGLRAERRAAALRFARNKGEESVRAIGCSEATDYGLRATRKPYLFWPVTPGVL